MFSCIEDESRGKERKQVPIAIVRSSTRRESPLPVYIDTNPSFTTSEALDTYTHFREHLWGAHISGPPPPPSKSKKASLQQAQLLEIYGVTKRASYDLGPGYQLSVAPSGGYSFELLPSVDPKQPHRIMLAAPPGSGKSTWIGQYMDQYHNMYPKNTIIIVSQKNAETDEPEFRVPFYQVDVHGKEFIETGEPLSVETLSNCLVVFDDTSTFPDAIKNRVFDCRDSLLKVGRSKNIAVISSSHELLAHRETKSSWANSTHVVVFPKTQRQRVIEVLKTKLGYSRVILKYVLSTDSRWVCFVKSAPITVMTQYDLWAESKFERLEELLVRDDKK